MFIVGLEKTAGLKHWALAGLVAASHGHKAKAADMAESLKDAVSKTETGKNIAHNLNKLVQGTKRVSIVGGEDAGKHVAGKAKKNFSLAIEDANKLRARYGNLTGELSHEGAKGSVDLPKGFSVSANAGKKEHRFDVGFKKDF